ncbi:alpha/beta hydrolase [Novosphingobium sp. KCTC 2891]|uniref:alpha/beta fold hydrolase n=1 Tax=Novosphingobium sp. KCTC 2891 TaxID=2989730 RepID=UPI002221A4FB|nr:alpha/beta hydrolase [Novosphingobium sp. KCTC 2891]MCW1383674.1 alpha/beta hydrolase [Novosphingobium sp. KCTC 2891]
MTGYLHDWLEQRWSERPRQFAVQVEGAAIACRGWNLAADLPGLVLVHGYRAHAAWWDHIGPALASQYRVVALSLSGMGESDRREGYSRAQFAREIMAVADACAMDPVTIVAHSFGSIPALMAAKACSEQVSRLVIIDAGLPIRGQPLHQIAAEPRRDYATREEAVGRFRLIGEGPAPVREVREYIARHSVREEEGRWTWAFDHLLPHSLNADAAFVDDLGGIDVPLDVVVGELTTIMTPPRVAEAQRIARRCGKPVVIPGSGHHVPIEQPLALLAALRGLLANPRRRVACDI